MIIVPPQKKPVQGKRLRTGEYSVIYSQITS